MAAQRNQNTTAAEPFHTVERKDVSRLMRSLEDHGPEALTVYPVLWLVLDWWKKNEDFRCTILAPDGGEDAGVCVMILNEYDHLRVFFYTPDAESARFISALKATKMIQWDSINSIARLTKRLEYPVCDIIKSKGLHFHKTDYRLMWISIEDALALTEKEPPENIRIRKLTEDDAAAVVEKWKFSRTDAVHLTRDSIKYSGGLGAVNTDGELIAWILWNVFGGLGQLYVLPSYRRLGLGRLLAIQMTKIITKQGLIVTLETEPDEPSFKMFQNIGFNHDYLDLWIYVTKNKQN